ncbi:serine--tRNA ligase [Patescibacteria group bacterium]|nr:serine--tRNA ligase [Patescibacteria group bacterium]MDL1953095.1 serine--tRNA ligase [Candidatus Uhrbacteria bacterium UHB]RIL00451.1 MAG: serine--tRNA ligase [Candidatus Uhrbacteria bacterium]
MLDIKFIREHSEEVKTNCRNRNVGVDIDAFLRLDAERAGIQRETEDLRHRRNEIAALMQTVSSEQRDGLIGKGKEIKQLLGLREAALAETESIWMEQMLRIPNMTHPDAPVSASEEGNREIRHIGEPVPKENAKDHVELAKEHDLIDFDRGAKVAGTKFYYLKGKLALLELALMRFALDEAMSHGFVPVTTPDLAKDEMIIGSGFQPRGEESQIYSIENHDLSLIGTSEITLGGYHAGEILAEDQLPIRYTGLSHCYRTEAGTYGRESYGLYRVHQFSKVEMYVFCAPEQSEAMHAELVRAEEALWSKLDIPYRVIDICTGDLGGPAYRKYDIEAWMPGKTAGDTKGAFGEVTSASNCTDYQARRLNIRMKRRDGSIVHVHTLNGTAIATSRAMLAILENYQKPDGSIDVPKALIPYCGFSKLA